MKAMRTLHATGLTLEPQTAAHAEAMFTVLNDKTVYTYLDEAPPVSATVLREYFERLESRASADGREQWLNWAIRLDAGSIAGFVQATVCEGGLAWIAFVLGQAHWGRGHAQHATRAMLDELAAHHGATHCLATADRANRRSIALLARLGFSLAPRT
jgi:[ribosomal protein S5]-alanine N-acetyltransferase